MADLLATGALIATGAALGYWIARLRARPQGLARGAGAPPAPARSGQGDARADSADPRAALYALAGQMESSYPGMAHPRDLTAIPQYAQGVQLLRSAVFTSQEVCIYAIGDNPLLSCMALDALRLRQDEALSLEALLPGINTVSNWSRWLLCELLEARHPQPVLERFLQAVNTSWDSPMGRQVLQDFVRRRLERGEEVRVDGRLAEPAPPQSGPFKPTAKPEFLAALIDEIGSAPARALAGALRAQAKAGRDVEALRAVGRILENDQGPPILEHRELARALAEGERAVQRSRALLVVGRPGVGKSTLVRALSTHLRARGFTVFEAGTSELLADQSMMGQLEGRLQKLFTAVVEAPVVWVVPDFAEFVWAGRHRFGATSVLDVLMPYLEAERLRIVGEIEPEGLDRLLRSQPRLRAALDVVRLESPSDEETLELLRGWARGEDGPPRLDEATLREAADLARQYLGETAAPGNLFGLVRLAAEARPAGDGRPVCGDDLLAALTRLTGLPAAILDEREALDLDALRALFARRVLGQPEAVDCLVERVAMLKAGLVDPGRPAGVFLFTGPTGTGKTEIARTLSEFLFGSPERLVRIDMSELTGPLAQARLLGSGDERSSEAALVHRIREQPFSVVLLDEVEKADAAIWDLLLQVFDAGRLTDTQGRTADFRHAIFILTSNLGSDLVVGQRLGFAPRAGGGEVVLDELARHFRPEFINRLDRVVVFRPLGRGVTRQILHKELERVLALRGLRTRQWVVEWDESALDFLLEKGFSPALGARPLRRAVERWFLSPLATAIVNRDAPRGDQFLFVRSDGRRIEVVFVDPDAPEEAADEVALREVEVPEGLTLGRVALEGSGTPGEVAFLVGVFERLAGVVRGQAWLAAHDSALAQMAEGGFWDSEQRFGVLSGLELCERVQNGLAHAERLLGRVRASNARASTPLVRQLAHELFLLEAATPTVLDGRPRDAFLSVEALRDLRDGALADGFAARLVDMYRAWATSRRMQLDELEHVMSDRAWRWTAAISGYGAHEILRPEAGWHVFELDSAGEHLRQRVRVSVLPQPDRPLRDALSEARQALAAHATKETHVVRRYRELPSPLVRDSVRGWRTGRIDRVLGGDFDLL